MHFYGSAVPVPGYYFCFVRIIGSERHPPPCEKRISCTYFEGSASGHSTLKPKSSGACARWIKKFEIPEISGAVGKKSEIKISADLAHPLLRLRH